MEVILVIHLFLALAIIGLVLLQRSEGGGLGMGGGGLGGLASPRSAANALTRATAFCALAFFCTSLILGILAGRTSTAGTSILDALDAPATEQTAPISELPDNPSPVREGGGEAPTAPIAE
ncbi:MAG: preprotein translocase subunit SecG [Alphaproteobacteria bacterium]|jgi:preprotein translocase subunit SecG|nr:preprotein translocase subunit SecG [Alphaproteobacteria bacterium]